MELFEVEIYNENGITFLSLEDLEKASTLLHNNELFLVWYGDETTKTYQLVYPKAILSHMCEADSEFTIEYVEEDDEE